MSRPSKYSAEQILDVALSIVAQRGVKAVTIAAIAQELGAPSGSIYHRFSSRDLLVASLWLRTVEEFQQGFFEALTESDPLQAALNGALYVLRWSRAHPKEGQLLLLYKREDLVKGPWPKEVSRKARSLSKHLNQELENFAQRLWPEGDPDFTALSFALIDMPYGSVRRYLSMGKPIPRKLDELVSLSVCAVLGHQSTENE